MLRRRVRTSIWLNRCLKSISPLCSGGAAVGKAKVMTIIITKTIMMQRVHFVAQQNLALREDTKLVPGGYCTLCKDYTALSFALEKLLHSGRGDQECKIQGECGRIATRSGGSPDTSLEGGGQSRVVKEVKKSKPGRSMPPIHKITRTNSCCVPNESKRP